MKLKLTVDGAESGDLDVLLTVDVTATIGEIARSLALGQPGGSRYDDAARRNTVPLTLRVRYPSQPELYVLDILATVTEAGLQSGCWVEVIEPSAAHATDVRLYDQVGIATIISGPQTGVEFALVNGTNLIGRGPGCRIHLIDDAVSRRHARLEIGNGVVVTDLNSGNGLFVDDVRVTTASLNPGSVISVGDTQLAIRQPNLPSALTPVARPKAVVEFSRSPRVDVRYLPKKLAAPVPPRRGEPQKFPLLAIIAPLIMGGVLYYVTRSPLSLIFIALSPIIMLGTYIDNVVTGRQKRKMMATQFDEALTSLNTKLVREREKELALRNSESPSTREVYEAMVRRNALLWARRPEHQTFLELRLGLGAQPSRITIELPSRNEADESYWERLDDLADQNATVSPVPVLEKFDRAGNLGVAGDPNWSGGVTRSLLVQLCGLHSPADLVLTCFADADNHDEWSWLKWLPHVGSAYSPIGASHLASDAVSSGHLVSQLEEMLAGRRAERAANGARIRSHLREDATIDDVHGQAVDELPITPAVIIVVTSDIHVDRGRLVALAEEGPDLGIHVLWHAAAVADLPAACRTYVDVHDAGTGTVGFVRSGARVAVNQLETIPIFDSAVAARLLSSVLDSGARELDESDLPSSVSYQDLQQENVIGSAEAVTALWTRNRSLTARWKDTPPLEAGKLSGIVGQGSTGPLRLDLREHGPHALVGGTTGSGKSEFLQTWIMSMASEYSPDRLTFLLVDYKGGAAFAECTQLPHTVGLVTDLNTHLVRRALTSLRAELHYRENLLNEKGAKDLISLEKRGDPDAPPSLVIVIDEFAALVGEVPEFVDGVVDVAQRGRSLGLHLVMATQRPAGVIKDNLRANTNLRIALRVADESDSQDVIGRKDAAGFDPGTPGRGAAKLGPGTLIHFQTGYLGGRTKVAAKMPDIDIADFPFDVHDSWPVVFPAPPVRREAPRDIENMLISVQKATSALQLRAPRKPWLNPLPELVDLAVVGVQGTLPRDPLRRDLGATAAEKSYSIPLGIRDEPERQHQGIFSFDPDSEGNLAILGTSGSGKSAALRTLALSASLQAPENPVHIYAIDFAGGALGTLANLPTVGAVISGEDSERVERLIRDLSAIAVDRGVRFSRMPASTLSEYRRISEHETEARIIVLIDGMANFRSAYEYRNGDSTFQAVSQLIAVGRQIGIHFVLSADRAGVIPTALSANIQQRIVLRMASSADYGILGIPQDILDSAPAGRAVVDGHEIQLAVIGGSASLSDQSGALEVLAVDLATMGVTPAPRVHRLAERIALAELPSVVEDRPVIGVADIDLLPCGITPEGLMVVTGPFRSGKTSALKTIVQSVMSAPAPPDALLISPRAVSELHDTTAWGSTALGLADAEILARELSVKFKDGGGAWPATGRTGFIVIENAGEFEGSTAESAVAGLIKAARKANVFVAVETDLATGPAAWQIYSELKTARSGIVLQPEESDAIGLFRVALPRGSRADFPEGRGYLVEAGRFTKLQVALPG